MRVEDNNWDLTAGMPGFLRAVIETYQHIALGTLEGHLQPWRPMVRYPGQGCAVIRADLPAADRTGPGTSLRWAAGVQVNEDRIDITEWLDVNDNIQTPLDLTEVLAGKLAQINANPPPSFLIPAAVIAKPIALEYSRTWIELLLTLQEQGADPERLLGHLACAATINQPDSDGPERAAVLFRVAADTEPTATGQDARFAVARLTQDDVRLLLGIHTARNDDDSADQMREEFSQAPVPWVEVYDGRPESILSRTAGRPTGKLAGVRILLLGCGGLGAPIAEHCARSGAACVHIVDSGTVNPGVLSRQPYEDADIGRLRPRRWLTGLSGSVREPKSARRPPTLSFRRLRKFDLGEYHLIIDATANRSVAAKIERAQRDEHDRWRRWSPSRSASMRRTAWPP